MSAPLNIFDSMRRRELRRHRSQLAHLKRAINNQDDENPLFLLKALLDEKAFGQSIQKSPKGNSNIRSVILKIAKFIFKVLVVLGLLYTAALVFAYLEDNDKGKDLQGEDMALSNGTKLNSSSKISAFWKNFQNEYDVKLTEEDQQKVGSTIAQMVEQVKVKRLEKATGHENDVSHLKIQKWFYFVVIASTTIGYGDVSPKTQNGRIFYCLFSVIGIILMMSLLKSCGAVITSVNKRFYRFVHYYLCPGKKGWSEESTSLLLLMVFFFAYLALGIWHDQIGESDEHTLVDIIYFWIVSFTTVGFGDIGHSLEFEIRHAYELTVYRVFGLSLLAAIIDTIISYVKVQQKMMKYEREACQRKILEKIQTALVKSTPQKIDKNKKCSVTKGLKFIGIPVAPSIPE